LDAVGNHAEHNRHSGEQPNHQPKVLTRRGSKTRSVRPCGASAKKSGINLCGVLTGTHVLDRPETILQRSDGDQEIVAARIQINRIVRARKVSRKVRVQNVDGAGKIVDQNPDLRRLSRHNVTLGTEVSLMFHFHSLRESVRRAWPGQRGKCPNGLSREQFHGK
jgi:hypothetical protein